MNKKGRTLLQFIIKNGLELRRPVSPTFYHKIAYKFEVLDITFVKNVTVASIDTINNLSSDHNPVIVELNVEPNCASPPQITKINWSHFSEQLEQDLGQLPEISTSDGLEDATIRLT